VKVFFVILAVLVLVYVLVVLMVWAASRRWINASS